MGRAISCSLPQEPAAGVEQGARPVRTVRDPNVVRVQGRGATDRPDQLNAQEKGPGACRALRISQRWRRYIMPPIPPMPPPGMAGAEVSFGSSATIASVVTRRPATDDASC